MQKTGKDFSSSKNVKAKEEKTLQLPESPQHEKLTTTSSSRGGVGKKKVWAYKMCSVEGMKNSRQKNT